MFTMKLCSKCENEEIARANLKCRSENLKCAHDSKTVWYKSKLFAVAILLIAIQLAHMVLDYFGVSILHNLVDAFYDYFKMIWLAVLIGLVFGGIIDRFIPKEYIMKYLSRRRKRTILYSVGFGFLMSACSHGILAISMELYKKGASIPAVITFLLASPWANLPITVLLFGFFGIKAALFVVSAIIIAVITGMIYQVLESKGLIESNKHFYSTNYEFSIIKDMRKRWRNYKWTVKTIKEDIFGVAKGIWNLANMVVWWILIGTLLASIARAYVPHGFFSSYMGATFLGMIVTLAIATVLEICSEGTAPLAFEVFKQTGAFGNTFVFLMAGVATDYTEIGLIWSNIGRKAALWLPVVVVPQVIILGYLFNLFV